MAAERLQKVLARAGIASRRKAEEIISEGRVRVDGVTVSELGTRVDARRSRIEVNGKRIVSEPLVYIIVNKPKGVVCTLSDPEGRRTIADLVRGVGARVYPVGRLDFATSGALLMSNDGEFAAVLQHPRHHVPKVYLAKLRGAVSEPELERWREPIEIDGKQTRPATVFISRRDAEHTFLQVELVEGKNRHIRRLAEYAGSELVRLVRLAHAGVSAEDLRPGHWRQLTVDELVKLKRAFGVPHRVRAPVPEAQQRRPARPGAPRPQNRVRPARAPRARVR
jgi:23S rRNA pseudouridine2605 synthase